MTYIEILLGLNLIVLIIGFSLSSGNQVNIARMLKTISDKINAQQDTARYSKRT